MYLIRTRQPSSSSFAMPPSRSLSSFPLLRGLKKWQDSYHCWTLLGFKQPCFYKGSSCCHAAGRKPHFHSVLSVFTLTPWTGWGVGGRMATVSGRAEHGARGCAGWGWMSAGGTGLQNLPLGERSAAQPACGLQVPDVRNAFAEGRILSISGQVVSIAKASQGQVLVRFRVHSKNARSLMILIDVCGCVHFYVCALESCPRD